jgi:hypothetical protein
MSNLTLKDIKNAQTGYLYPDQHLVIVYEKKDKDARQVQWVQIWENCKVKCLLPDSRGRVIMDKEFLPFFIHVSKLEINVGINQGSNKTKELGLVAQSVILHTKGTGFGWVISVLPDLISSDIYWHNCEGRFQTSDAPNWGGLYVKNIFRKEKS